MKKIIAVGAIIVIAIVGFFAYNAAITPDDVTIAQPQSNPSSTTETAVPQSFNKAQYPLDQPTSIWVIVNKQRSLPVTYVPTLVVPDVRLRLTSSEQQMQIGANTAPAVKELFVAAKAEGVNLVFGSGYRSATLQKQFYDSYVAKSGQAEADTYSARPGHSEHQSGLAMDITSPSGTCHLEICWKNTAEGKWLAANANKYGFVIRYPEGKEMITGYQYEPWHIRYVGKELAAELATTNQTLEEFFEIGPANLYD